MNRQRTSGIDGLSQNYETLLFEIDIGERENNVQLINWTLKQATDN